MNEEAFITIPIGGNPFSVVFNFTKTRWAAQIVGLLRSDKIMTKMKQHESQEAKNWSLKDDICNELEETGQAFGIKGKGNFKRTDQFF